MPTLQSRDEHPRSKVSAYAAEGRYGGPAIAVKTQAAKAGNGRPASEIHGARRRKHGAQLIPLHHFLLEQEAGDALQDVAVLA